MFEHAVNYEHSKFKILRRLILRIILIMTRCKKSFKSTYVHKYQRSKQINSATTFARKILISRNIQLR